MLPLLQYKYGIRVFCKCAPERDVHDIIKGRHHTYRICYTNITQKKDNRTLIEYAGTFAKAYKIFSISSNSPSHPACVSQ